MAEFHQPRVTMSRYNLEYRIDRFDLMMTRWMARHGLIFLRVALGIVFFWFGALKLFPGLSPAEELVKATVPFLPGRGFMIVLAIWEMLIGLGFITGRALRATILLLFLQMPGTMAPIVLLPDWVFTVFPYGLTIEGQYIIKNVVLISAALVIGSTVRRRSLLIPTRPAEASSVEPPAESPDT